MVILRHAATLPICKDEAALGVRRIPYSFRTGAIRVAFAFFLAACAVARLRADNAHLPGVPARVFSLYNDRVYIEEIGYLESSGFRPDVSFTPFFRTLNPALVANGTPDEIAAAAGKVLITQADWLNSVRDGPPAAAPQASRLPPSTQIYTIAGVSYVALGTGGSRRLEAVVGKAPAVSEVSRAVPNPAAPTAGSHFIYWQ